jgi:hypothetical protein
MATAEPLLPDDRPGLPFLIIEHVLQSSAPAGESNRPRFRHETPRRK